MLKLDGAVPPSGASFNARIEEMEELGGERSFWRRHPGAWLWLRWTIATFAGGAVGLLISTAIIPALASMLLYPGIQLESVWRERAHMYLFSELILGRLLGTGTRAAMGTDAGHYLYWTWVGLCTGLCVGSSQVWVLRRHLAGLRPWRWIALTICGVALGLPAFYAAQNVFYNGFISLYVALVISGELEETLGWLPELLYENRAIDLIRSVVRGFVFGMSAGTLLGTAQAMLLRRHVRFAGLWALTNQALCIICGFFLFWFYTPSVRAYSDGEGRLDYGRALTAGLVLLLVVGGGTGLVLTWLPGAARPSKGQGAPVHPPASAGFIPPPETYRSAAPGAEGPGADAPPEDWRTGSDW